jgi:hypothetical protein
LLRRKNFSIEGDDYSCVLCTSGLEELTYHLIFQCPFAERCWNLLNIHWDHNLGFFDTFQKAKSEWQLRYFMETFAIAAWEIWKIRNNKIFRGEPPFLAWKINFATSIKLQIYRLKLDDRRPVLAWLESLV